MKLNDLISSNNWLSVELTLLQLYPDQGKMISGYRNVYEKLKITESTEYDELEIILTEHECDPSSRSDKETCVDVSGQKKILDSNEITNGYALEFLEWDKWLGMDIAAETTKKFSALEIIAHCLYEMTFIGYNEEARQERLIFLDNIVEEYENLKNKEEEQQTILLDELKKLLDEEEDHS